MGSSDSRTLALQSELLSVVSFASIASSILSHVVPDPSVTVASEPASPIFKGTDVILTCTVELSPSVVDSDLSVVMVDTQLSRDGTPLTPTDTMDDTTFTYTVQLDSFGNDDIGNYTCISIVRPRQPSTFLTESSEQSDTARVTSGNYGTQIKMPSFCIVNYHQWITSLKGAVDSF